MARGAGGYLFVAARRTGRWAAWIAGQRLVELHIEETGRESLIGSIHLGRVLRVETGLAAAFIDIGLSEPGFLPLADMDGSLVEGAPVTVQVTRDAADGKAPRLTGRPLLKAPLLSLTPGRRGIALSAGIRDRAERDRLAAEAKPLQTMGGGFILRRAAQGAKAAALAAEADRLHALWQEVKRHRDSAAPPRCLYREPASDIRLLRDHGSAFREVVYDARRAAEAAQRWCRDNALPLPDRIAYRRAEEWVPSPMEIVEEAEAALAPEVTLNSGAVLRFEPGRTLTAIDVDTGSYVGGQHGADAEHALLRVDLEAADEIARQVRLRNLGGIIVIDFIDLKRAEHRGRVVERLRQAVADDTQFCRVGGMSKLGLVEMTRSRRGPSLAARFSDPCPRCEGAGRLLRSLSMMSDIGAPS